MEADKEVDVETSTKVNDDASAPTTSGSPSVLVLQEETKDANNASSTSTAPSLLAEDSNPSENKKLTCSSEILQSPTRVVELSSTTTTTTTNASTSSSTSSASAAPSSTVLSMPETSVVVKKNDEQTEETASPATQIKSDDTSSVDTASRTNSSGADETKDPMKTSSSLTVPASKTVVAGVKTVTTPVPGGKVVQSTSHALSKKQSSSSSSSHSTTPNKATTSGTSRPSSPSSAASSSGGFAAVASKAFEAVSEAVSDVRSAASDVAAAKANASSHYHDGYDYNVMTPYQIFGSKVLGKTIYGEFECTNRHHFGSLYMGSRALCFYGKLFGLERKVIMPYGMICNIERYKTNGILIKVDSKANTLTDGYGNPLPSPPPPKFSPKNASANAPPSSPAKKKAYTSLPISIDEYVFYVDLATLDSSSTGATTGSEHTSMSTDSSFNSGGSCASDMDDVLNLFLDLKERFKCGFLADDDILGTGYTGSNKSSTHSKAPQEPPMSTNNNNTIPQESPPRTTRKPLRATADDMRVSVRYLPHPMYRRSNTAPNSPKSEVGEDNDNDEERRKSVRFDDSGLIDLSNDLIHVGETKDGRTAVLKPSFQGEAVSDTSSTTGTATTTTTSTDRPSMKGSRTNSQALAAVTAMADFRSFSIVYGSKEKQQELAKMTYDLEHEDTPTKDTTTGQEKEEQVSVVVEAKTEEEKTSTAIQKEEEALTKRIKKVEEVVSSKKMKEQEEEQKMEIDNGPEDDEDKIDIPTNVQLEWNKIINETPKQYKDTALKLQLSNCSSVDKFFKLFLSDTAPYSIAKYMEHHGDIELNVSKWKLSKRQFVTKRIVKYVHPVNAPMAPPQAAAQKNQWMRKYSTDKIVIDTKTSVSDVPMTDCFYMQDRWLIESSTSDKGDGGGVTLTVHFQVTFVKSTMFRRIIEKTSKEEFLKFITAYGKMVQDSLKHEEMKEKSKLLPVTIAPPPVAKEEGAATPAVPAVTKKEEEVPTVLTKEKMAAVSPPATPTAAAAIGAAGAQVVAVPSTQSFVNVLPPFVQQILQDPKMTSIAIMGMGLFIVFWMMTTFILTYMTYKLWKEVSLLRHDIDIALTNNVSIVPAGEFVEDIMNVPTIMMDG